MDEYLLIISLHKSGCQAPALPVCCRLICIGRLRCRKRSEVGPRVGDGGRWWIIVLSSQRGTFVNVWLVLNGLLLDYRVWGPKLDRPLLFGDSASWVSCDWTVAVCWQRGREEEGGGHFCYAVLSECFIVLNTARSCLDVWNTLHVGVVGIEIARL